MDMLGYGLDLPVRTVYAVFEDGSRLVIASTDTLEMAEAKAFCDEWDGWHGKKVAALELRNDSTKKIVCSFKFMPDYKDIPLKESLAMNR